MPMLLGIGESEMEWPLAIVMVGGLGLCSRPALRAVVLRRESGRDRGISCDESKIAFPILQ